MTTDVVGREAETRAIEHFLDRAASTPQVLVLSGEPGIGKSALWENALARARTRGARVLTHRAVEAEAVLSFAGLSDLFADSAADVLPSLGDLRRRALQGALLLDGPPAGGAVDPRAIGLAVLDGLRVLASETPVIVAVDDVQWLDTASARTLLFALRRLEAERVGALMTARGSARELERGLGTVAVERLTVGPLGIDAVFALLRHRLGLELSRPQLTQVCEVTAGNPFFALEIGRELAVAPPAPGRPLRIPGSLREVVGERLARLPDAGHDALLLAAALARPTVDALVRAHDDRQHVLAGLEEAARAGVLELDEQQVRFTHPLLASACYSEAAPWRRRQAHARLAAVVGDEEERARHLALATDGADAGVAAALDAAAPHALARGVPAAAAELSEIAAELTPANAPAARRRRRLAAAEAHRLAGDRDRASAILDELLAETPAGTARADVLFALARVRRADLPTISRWCEDALAQTGDDHRRAAEILTFLSWMRLLQGRVRDALEHARAAFAHAERSGDERLLARAIARTAMAETWTLDITPGLLERGVAIEERLAGPLEFHESPRVTRARRLMCLAEFDAARPLLALADESARTAGDEGTRAHVLFHRFQIEWFTGRWDAADRLASEALELAGQLRDEQYGGVALYARALLDAHLGREEPAEAAAREAVTIADALSDSLFALQSRTVLGFLELSRGDAAAADGHLHALPAWLRDHGWNEPTDFAWTNAIEAMIGTGALADAAEWLNRYEALAERSTSPWALATAARGRGLLRAASGDVDGALEALQHALAEHERAQCPFEHARTLLAMGTVRRRARAKRAARETLDRACAMFEDLGARLWVARAHAERERISGRRPASGELTATEMQLALLVRDGLTNKEIAAALHLSVHTVEAHLTRIYRKLGVRSRTTLAQHVPVTGEGDR